jgi:hypothetical protein
MEVTLLKPKKSSKDSPWHDHEVFMSLHNVTFSTVLVHCYVFNLSRTRTSKH